MKIIELYTVSFLDWTGIILTDSHPSVEATEENIAKLRGFIESGILRMYDPEIDPEPAYENPFEPYMEPVTNPFLSGEYILGKEAEPITTRVVEDVNEVSEAAVEATNDFSKLKKKELEEKLAELGIDAPSNAKKEQLIEMLEKVLEEKAQKEQELKNLLG